MADAHSQLQEEDENPTEPVVVLKKPRSVNALIQWSKTDEELRFAHKKKVKKSRKPTMWEYNSKGGVPTEFANLEPSTFLTSRQGRILCFLPKNILIRICSMLSVCDFVDLSLTCRFLHWRMFTFCTCYAPYSVQLFVWDKQISRDLCKKTNTMPLTFIYSLNNEDRDGFDPENQSEAEDLQQYFLEEEGRRGVFIHQPYCLRKPFFFDTLMLKLCLPFYHKKNYDMFLSEVMAVRGLARNLHFHAINHTIHRRYLNFSKLLWNFSDTNHFFTAVNVSYYECRISVYLPSQNDNIIVRNNKDIYLNCPYARQMNRVLVVHGIKLQTFLNVPIFENRIGVYFLPLNSAIIATLNDFLAGSKNLILHKYSRIEEYNGRFPLLEYLFEEFGEFDEFFYARTENYRDFYHCNHIWRRTIETENGELLRIEMKKSIDRYQNNNYITVTIGKEEMFDEMINKYMGYPSGSVWWQMETAVEPDDIEGLDESKKSKETEKSDDSEESEEESEETEKSDDSEESENESEEAEEEQKESSTFCCLTNNSCPIQ